jgi:hypothetical protein
MQSEKDSILTLKSALKTDHFIFSLAIPTCGRDASPAVTEADVLVGLLPGAGHASGGVSLVSRLALVAERARGVLRAVRALARVRVARHGVAPALARRAQPQVQARCRPREAGRAGLARQPAVALGAGALLHGRRRHRLVRHFLHADVQVDGA